MNNVPDKTRRLWWGGKLLDIDEFKIAMHSATRKEMLRCQVCLKPFTQVSKYEWKGDCVHIPANMRIGVAGE